MNQRIEEALNSGLQAFWAEIAAAFPEITSGDLSPEVTLKLEQECRSAIEEWVQGNRVVPPFTVDQLQRLGINVSGDQDQPGLWQWFDTINQEGCDTSLSSMQKALQEASTYARENGGLTQCDNCSHVWREDQLKSVEKLSMRVAPGEAMPSGECPDCGCLCFPLD